MEPARNVAIHNVMLNTLNVRTRFHLAGTVSSPASLIRRNVDSER